MTLTDDEVDTSTIRDVDGIQTRRHPVTHTSVHRPLCAECMKSRMYFDLKCSGCRHILYKDNTSIAQVFAILRQWNPETQQNIEFYIREILRRGAHPDDRDSNTGMTLLHFAVKAGADGIADPRAASRAIKLLLNKVCPTYGQWVKIIMRMYVSLRVKRKLYKGLKTTRPQCMSLQNPEDILFKAMKIMMIQYEDLRIVRSQYKAAEKT